MISSAAIFVAHPDDEINVAGALIYQLRKAGTYVTVVYTTNGDHYPSETKCGKTRMLEAIRACEQLGVPEKNVLFLGYGDGWQGEKHIYNQPEKKECVSYAGRNCTYGLTNHQDYAYAKSGEHHKYTRKNYLCDIQSVISELEPDLIVSIDFDSHPDHRATSLLVEEAVKLYILRNDKRPIVLKKFAYACSWTGKKDYYTIPFQKTKKPNKELLNDSNFDLDVPAYTWDSRIAFEVSSELKKIPIFRNPLYKAALEHHSQHTWYLILRIANDDIVYWWRNTNGLQYRAQIEASSGETRFLNDYKLIDCSDIAAGQKGYAIFDECCWVPLENDQEKKIVIHLENPSTIMQVSLYENFCPGNNINDALIELSNGFSIHTGELVHSGAETVIIIPKQETITEVFIKILAWKGKRPGLTEVEIYDSVQHFPAQDFPTSFFERGEEKKIGLLKRLYHKLEYVALSVCRMFQTRLNPIGVLATRRRKAYDRRMWGIDQKEDNQNDPSK